MAGDTKAALTGALQQFRDVQRDAAEASLADLPTDLIDSPPKHRGVGPYRRSENL
jgi:hypothetical protein